MYGQSYSTGPPASGYEGSSHSHSYPPSFSNSMTQVGSKPPMRVPNQKQKPQCWEHNCNGRQFSTFSNLLRHQRERSGTASKSYCPRCNAGQCLVLPPSYRCRDTDRQPQNSRAPRLVTAIWRTTNVPNKVNPLRTRRNEHKFMTDVGECSRY